MAEVNKSRATFTLAHLSDVHLGPLPAMGIRDWNLKRLLGWANWHRKRRRLYSRPVLAQLVDDLIAQSPDHIAITGDLANLGLPAEHEAALAWLRTVGTHDQVTVIPGNHDIYTSIGGDPGTDRWYPYMSANGLDAEADAVAFPFVRRYGDIALIALNSAIPTRPFFAIGRIGDAQLRRLDALLQQLGDAGLMRVVLIHHPPLPGLSKKRHDLEDADALAEVLARRGAELVLHGHEHTPMHNWHPASSGAIPVIGVPSASLAVPYKKEPLARYHLYRLKPGTAGLAIELISRGLAEPGGPVLELERRKIVPAIENADV